jgi:hypothetical protein
MLHFANFISQESLGWGSLTDHELALLRSPAWHSAGERLELELVETLAHAGQLAIARRMAQDGTYVMQRKTARSYRYVLTAAGARIHNDRHLAKTGLFMLLTDLAGCEHGFTACDMSHHLRALGVNSVSDCAVKAGLDALSGSNERGLAWLERFTSDSQPYYRLAQDGWRVRMLNGASQAIAAL